MLLDDDVIRLRHMLEAARSAQRFAADRTRGDLEADEMLQFALVHAIQIIGEAASQVGERTRQTVADIPWPAIVGMRHRLVHAYFAVRLDRVWEVVERDLPVLIAALERALAHEETP